LIDAAVGKTHRPVRVVGNLPYYVSTPIIQRLVQLRRLISDMTFMLQEEVADRIVSDPGGKEYGYLTVLVQFYCSARKAFRVSPSAFRPAPKVWSAVVRLDVRETPAVKVEDEQRFMRFVRFCFAQRRKTVLNNLKVSLKGLRSAEMIQSAMAACGVGTNRRAETLSHDEFASLFRSLDLDNMAEVRNQAHIEDHGISL
jgi:16S rRNA (adenine1518-N6/adenine1519-N6)-dimethyltransferase